MSHICSPISDRRRDFQAVLAVARLCRGQFPDVLRQGGWSHKWSNLSSFIYTSSHNHGSVKNWCISNSRYLSNTTIFPLNHDYGRKSILYLYINILIHKVLPKSCNSGKIIINHHYVWGLFVDIHDPPSFTWHSDRKSKIRSAWAGPPIYIYTHTFFI